MSMVLDMASVLNCALPSGSGIYASAPITSGRRRSSALNNLSVSDTDIKRLVIEPNISAAREFVEELQRIHGPRVIDPTKQIGRAHV